MAYAATISYSDEIIAGRRVLLVKVAEVEAAAASEYQLSLGAYFPSGKWTLKRFKLVETSGTAATTTASRIKQCRSHRRISSACSSRGD